ncbi:MAG: hypothetical protein AAGF56_05280 [Pseudomonadota bacterium]
MTSSMVSGANMLQGQGTDPAKGQDRMSRRVALPLMGAMALAGCQPDGPTVATPPGATATGGAQLLRTIRVSTPPRNLTPQTQGFTPQFYDGANNTPDLIEIGYSYHCGATRAWMRRNGRGLVADLRAGRKGALFSHVIRSANELPVGVEVMRVGPERYPEAVFAALGLSLQLDRPVSATEMRLFLSEAGFRPARGFSQTTAEVALLGVAKVYQDGLGRRSTPIIINSQVG